MTKLFKNPYCGRALHYVLKIGNRGENAFFFRDILGMKVQRHEEFTEGCAAKCNGPYDNRWSKTMVGFGPECSHFVMELTYNYGVSSYTLGNDFAGITIKSKEIIERIKSQNYCHTSEGSCKVLTSPDGYKFYILNESVPTECDPIVELALNCTNLCETKNYWVNILKMNIVEQSEKSLVLAYDKGQTHLRFNEIDKDLKREEAYGRVAFSVPAEMQPIISEKIEEEDFKILTPLVKLDTPDKPSVQVVILADPDGHEICFVDEEGFSELSVYEEDGNDKLDQYICKDPFQCQ